MSDEPKCGPCADGRPCADHPRPPVSDQTPSPERPEGWFAGFGERWCRAHGWDAATADDDPWLCERPVGHDGPHEVEDIAISRWADAAPPAPTPEPRRATVCKHPEHAPGVGESHCHCWLNLEDPCCWCGSDEDSADPCPNRPTPSPVSPEDGDEPATWADLLTCERCGRPLEQPGALMFSPPNKAGMVRKHHICADCYLAGEGFTAASGAGCVVTPPPEFDPYALLDHPELAKAPGVHDGKRTEPCLCTSDDSGSSHDAQHPGEYLNDYGDWEECGWCGGRGFCYADCTRCDGSSFEPADPPAPLPDTGDGQPAEPTLTGEPNDEPWVIYENVRRIVYGPAGFDDVEDEYERRNDPELGTMPARAPSPSQPEPGTLDEMRKLANEGGTEDVPSVDVCGHCSDSECDGIGCIAALDPDDSDDHPAIERLHLLLRAGHALLTATPLAAPPAAPGDRPDTLRSQLQERLAEASAAYDRHPGDEYANGLYTAYEVALHLLTEQDVQRAADAQPAHPAPDGEATT